MPPANVTDPQWFIAPLFDEQGRLKEPQPCLAPGLLRAGRRFVPSVGRNSHSALPANVTSHSCRHSSHRRMSFRGCRCSATLKTSRTLSELHTGHDSVIVLHPLVTDYVSRVGSGKAAEPPATTGPTPSTTLAYPEYSGVLATVPNLSQVQPFGTAACRERAVQRPSLGLRVVPCGQPSSGPKDCLPRLAARLLELVKQHRRQGHQPSNQLPSVLKKPVFDVGLPQVAADEFDGAEGVIALVPGGHQLDGPLQSGVGFLSHPDDSSEQRRRPDDWPPSTARHVREMLTVTMGRTRLSGTPVLSPTKSSPPPRPTCCPETLLASALPGLLTK